MNSMVTVGQNNLYNNEISNFIKFYRIEKWREILFFAFAYFEFAIEVILILYGVLWITFSV